MALPFTIEGFATDGSWVARSDALEIERVFEPCVPVLNFGACAPNRREVRKAGRTGFTKPGLEPA